MTTANEYVNGRGIRKLFDRLMATPTMLGTWESETWTNRLTAGILTGNNPV